MFTRFKLSAVRTTLNKLVSACCTGNRKTFKTGLKTRDQKTITTLGHEIRTPINGIVSMAERILAAAPSLQIETYTKAIINESDALLRMIDDMLALSKIKNQKLVLTPEYIELESFIQNMTEIHRITARQKDLDFIINNHNKKSLSLYIDPVRLRQILHNLVGNAIKFTNQGHICIELKSGLSHMNTERKAVETLIIKISDTGIGISEETIEAIFDEYVQESAEIQARYGGTGLGLNICQNLIHLMDGELTVHSEKNKGTEFTLYLPIKSPSPPDKDAHVSQDEVENEKYKIFLPGAKVLIVDDDPVNQAYCKEILETIEAECRCVSNGKEAIEFLQKERYDLVVMDCFMPEMDGYETSTVINTMKEDGLLEPDLPIMALTANTRKEDKERGFVSGMNDYLTKPVDKDQLIFSAYRLITGEVIDTKDRPPCAFNSVQGKIIDLDIYNKGQALFKERHADVIDLFLNQSNDRIKRLLKQLKRKDRRIDDDALKSIIHLSHTIKASSYQIGAIQMSQIADSIEKKARTEKLDRQNTLKKTQLDQTTVFQYLFDQTVQLQTTYQSSQSMLEDLKNT